eukprot:gnl/TRDRNA2_/TRDRNA2_184681_c0_seq1.p1 gnl/TRDRNA2_/TRDRNA2_184681_c0~~gnl/TRDRNA2_/TRDRNA2_184681_c0_seq1.p1  ORF type:complete len:302 (-),score=35.45 gnl/TRDRNA2_/TRDRNA2_184681_c0_seq1:21-926(-)
MRQIRCARSRQLANFLVGVVCVFVLQGCNGGSGGGGSFVDHGQSFMDCGHGVALCGVLSLESGFGKGAYSHSEPVVHGLWPAVGNHGSSKCIRPTDHSAPKSIYPCYSDKSQSRQSSLKFEDHEWTNHGDCAGVSSANDYFKKVCSLAKEPLVLLTEKRVAGHNKLKAMAERLVDAGYPVYGTQGHTGELRLSACSKGDGEWKFSKVEDFAKNCGANAAASQKSRAEEEQQNVQHSTVQKSHAEATSCTANERGPACTSNEDCSGEGCLRCAKSGYCTATPLPPKRSALLQRLSVSLRGQD